MSLETNANIPTPYVYKPADFTGILDARAAATKAAVKKQEEQDKADKKLLNVDLSFTTEEALNEDLKKRYNYIVDTYAKLQSEGNLSDLSTDVGAGLDQEKKGLLALGAEYKRKAAEVANLESLKSSDPAVYSYYQTAIAKANKEKNTADLIGTIDEFTANKPLFVNKPNVTGKVSSMLGTVGLDSAIDAITEAAQTPKDNTDKIIELQKTINEEKIPTAVAQLKSDPDIIAEEQIYNFKKEKGIIDPKYGDNETFDEYLADLVAQQASLRSATAQQYRQKGTFNFNISSGGGIGQTAGGATVTPVETGKTTVPINFSSGNIKYEKGKLIIPTDQAAIETPKEWGAFDKIKIKDGKAEVPLEGMWYLDDSTGKNEWNISNFNTSSKQAVSEHKSSFTLPDIDQTPVKNSSIVSLKKTQDGSIWAKLDNGNKILIATPHSELMQKVKDNGVELYRIMYGGKGSLTAGDVNNFWLGKVTPGQDIDFSINLK